MDFKNDILQEISYAEIVGIRDRFKNNWPYGVYFYNFLNVTLRWKRDHGYSIQFFCPDGRYEDGTIITICEDFFRVTCFTLDKSNARLVTALRDTKRINWRQFPNFFYLHKDQTPVVLDALVQNSLMPHVFHPSAYWWIPKETAAKYTFSVPEGTYLGPLTLSHAAQIHAVWPHRDDIPMRFIANLIEFNGGVGLFQARDHALSAWIVQNDYAALAILQTDVEHRGKGYAVVVTKAMCKELARRGIDPTAMIMIGNMVSESLFRKLDFEVVNFISWIGSKPIK